MFLQACERKVYAYSEPVDMRKSFNGLIYLPVVKIKEGGAIHTAAMPPMVVDRSFSDVSFYAEMLVDKFVYHIPLNRQFETLRVDGIIISRVTLPSQSMRAIMLLEPVYQAQAKSVLESSVIAMDDTWMKVGVSSPGKMHKGRGASGRSTTTRTRSSFRTLRVGVTRWNQSVYLSGRRATAYSDSSDTGCVAAYAAAVDFLTGRGILRLTRCHPHLSWCNDKNQGRRLKIKSCLLLR
ncbi:MAG: transposase [Proteobacteria bacterium]|nr:transposase [Pseudomonadota bacterium]